MKISIKVSNLFANDIISCVQRNAKDMGRKMKKLTAQEKTKIVAKVAELLFNDENTGYFQEIERIEEWIDADRDGDCIFEKIVKRNSVKDKSHDIEEQF